MDQDNERLLDPDSNPPLDWWSDLDAPSAPPSSASDPSQTDPPTNKASTTTASKPKPTNKSSENPKSETRNPKSAVIDRFEGKWAVLLVGDDEKVLNVPRSSLPKRVRAGHWLKIEQSEDNPENLISAEIDKTATDAARARIADKLAKLRSGEHLK